MNSSIEKRNTSENLDGGLAKLFPQLFSLSISVFLARDVKVKSCSHLAKKRLTSYQCNKRRFFTRQSLKTRLGADNHNNKIIAVRVFPFPQRTRHSLTFYVQSRNPDGFPAPLPRKRLPVVISTVPERAS